jgi:hypothetical protein
MAARRPFSGDVRSGNPAAVPFFFGWTENVAHESWKLKESGHESDDFAWKKIVFVKG